MFVNQFLPDNNLEQINTPNGRYYETPDGQKFYSVTTLLGWLQNDPAKKKSLERWKQRVGEDQADRILTQAGRRGTIIHDTLEKFLKNDPDPLKGLMPVNKETIKPLLPILEEHITTVYGLEHQLWSKALKASGTADCIALWDGELAIVDFKTARSNRNASDILDYFYQATAYAIMCYERHRLVIRKIVIVMHIDHAKPKVFVRDTKEYALAVINLFKQAPSVEA